MNALAGIMTGGCGVWWSHAGMGVTDGSVAPPGMIGELIVFSNTVSFPAAPQSVTLTTMGTLPAGDWNMQATFDTVTPNITGGFLLDNVPHASLDLSNDQENALLPPGMTWMGVELRMPTGVECSMFTRNGYYRSCRSASIVLRTAIFGATVAGSAQLGFVARRVR